MCLIAAVFTCELLGGPFPQYFGIYSRVSEYHQRPYIYINVVCCVGSANARNVRPYYPYWQYTDLFVFPYIYIYIAK